MHKFFTIFLVSAGLLATNAASAQDFGNSPYSRLGIGEMNNTNGSIRSFSMGNTGASAPNSNQLNLQNPALLYYNNTVIFELSVASQLKTLKEAEKSQRDGSTTLNAISMGFPISKRWTAAVGLRPFSTVQYEATSSQSVAGDPNTTALVKYSGEGTLSEVHFGHGVKIAKDLTLGASGSFVFGTIDNYFVSKLDGPAFQELVIIKETTHNGFLFKSGASYRHKIGTKYQLGVGGVYNFASKLNADQRFMTERRTSTGLFGTRGDSTIDQKVSLPSGFQLGVSLDNSTNWSLNADVETKNWANFRSIEGKQEFVDAMRVGLGGEYVPEPASPRYFRRVAYRAGLSTGKTQYQIGGQQLNETAVTWGFTFPLGRALVTESYYLNLGFALGKRGTTENKLVQENFIRIQGGLSLNNRWFVKRQLD